MQKLHSYLIIPILFAGSPEICIPMYQNKVIYQLTYFATLESFNVSFTNYILQASNSW